MAKKLKMKNRHRFFIINMSNLLKILVYNRAFHTERDAEYVVARYFKDQETMIVRGLFLIIYKKYRVIPFPLQYQALKPSQGLANHPNSEARIRRGRAILKQYPSLKILIPKKQSRSGFYSTLAGELLIS
ncbi:MAG: hypothetical protein RBR40_06395 [Tenuifilaceae bacterium]|jgi:hypothetical protein|nr:hypothetical protein [Tenuifilaceae bacterium]